MLRRPKPQFDLLDQIDFQLADQESPDQEMNPETIAKNRLFQISDEQVDQNFLEVTQNIKNQRAKDSNVKKMSETFRVKELKAVPQSPRLPVANHFTQSHRIWRKKSNKVLEQEPVSPPKQECPKNQSSFIIFENGYLNHFNSEQNNQITFGVAFPRTTKVKPSRNIMSLIKRKKVANMKQQVLQNPKSKRSLSPTERISKSCELRKDWQQISPIKIAMSDRIQQNEMHGGSPSFRNKRIANYIKMRANAHRNSSNHEPYMIINNIC